MDAITAVLLLGWVLYVSWELREIRIWQKKYQTRIETLEFVSQVSEQFDKKEGG